MSFFNRFRSGEAPMGVSGYTLYTQLVSSAPEIRGLWDMVEIPGTVMEDGTLNRSETASVTGCVMLSAAVDRGVDKDAFEFMNWWAGSETQTQYAKEVEGVLGVIGRIAVANRKTLAELGWSEEEFELIDRQLSCTINQPQVIGNYTITRSITSALRGAINDKNTPRRSLSIYNKDINDEITRKRIEFGLDVGGQK